MRYMPSLVKCISLHLPMFWEDLSELRKQELLNSLICFCHQIYRWSLQHHIFLLLESIFDHLETKFTSISHAGRRINPHPVWGRGRFCLISRIFSITTVDNAKLSVLHLASVWHLPSKCQHEESLDNFRRKWCFNDVMSSSFQTNGKCLKADKMHRF